MSRPDAAHALEQRAVPARVHDVEPGGDDADDAPPASSAPSCTAPSMPMASPLTTVTPARASMAPRSCASARPLGVAARVPTTATRGRSRALRRRRPRRAAPPAVRGLLVERVARPSRDVARAVSPRHQGRVDPVRSLRRRQPGARQRLPRRELVGRRPLAQHRRPPARARVPPSAPTGPPPRSTSARNRPGSCREGTPASPPRPRPDRRAGAGRSGRAHGTSPRIPRRGSRWAR